MHLIYLTVWKLAISISRKTKFKKKKCFLLTNILLWLLAGIISYLMFALTPLIEYSVSDMFVVAGYAGVIMGYFGAVMFILRNTEPDDLK